MSATTDRPARVQVIALNDLGVLQRETGGLLNRRGQPPAGPADVPRPGEPARPGRGAEPPRRAIMPDLGHRPGPRAARRRRPAPIRARSNHTSTRPRLITST